MGCAILGRRWLDRSLRFKGFTVLALPLSMLFVATTGFYFASSEWEAAQRRVTHSREVAAQLATVGGSVLDGETGIRGFLASGDERFLEPTVLARDRLPGELDRLAGQVSEHPRQAERVQRLRAALAEGYQVEVPPGLTSASEAARLGEWLSRQKVSTDRVRGLLAAMADTERRLLADRLARRDAWTWWARVGMVAALAVGLAGGLLSMRAFTVGIAARLERLRLDTDGLPRGELGNHVDAARDEIGVLSRRLHEVGTRWLMWQSEAHAARSAAEAANRAKSEFLSRMSHELRTPLNAVLGFAQILEMDLPPDQQDSVRQIRRAGRHLLDLINEVLDISRIEAGQMALSPEPVGVLDLIDEAVELIAPLAAAQGVTVHAAPRLCDCHVLADRQRAKQVLLNLLSNAVKYNRRDGTVTVQCVIVDETTAVIEVHDTGIGIPAQDLPKLFVPFERLGAAQSDIEGTGVGLALSRRLAQVMGGDLEVSSEAGRGSVFTFSLPVTLAPAPGGSTAAREQPGAAGVGGSVRTVLSIEDNLANTRLLEQIIARRRD